MIADFTPASTDSDQACGSLKWRVVMPSFATAPIEGSASPRKPSVRIRKRSSSSSLEVAWRSTASARSPDVMPSPSSVTPIRRRPPPSVKMSIRLAPASMAFSTSSLTTLAGRSTTSPAAMRLTICSGSWRTGMGFLSGSGKRKAQSRSFCRAMGGRGRHLSPFFTRTGVVPRMLRSAPLCGVVRC